MDVVENIKSEKVSHQELGCVQDHSHLALHHHEHL